MDYGPYITIDLDKIEQNARAITGLCARSGIEVCGVTKVTCGLPQVARAMLRGGVTSIGESRMKNIHRLKANGVNTRYILLRIPPLSAVDDIVTSVDISLNSELSVIAALSEAAHRRSLVHRIIIMVDLGDLREGVWPDDLMPLVREVVDLPGIRIVGLGTNLSCYGGVVPSEENMGRLVEYATEVESRFKLKLKYISGGNSSSLNLIAAGRMPRRINHIRIGEGILLGRETIHRQPWPGTNQDAFLLQAEVIELKEKPSVPIGETGEDAFGGKPDFVDHGERDRAILNIGREDVDIEGLKPVDGRLAILGASSDHLLLDVTGAEPPVRLGDELRFYMNYSALLAAMTSEYVDKRPLRDKKFTPEHRGVVLVNVSLEDPAARPLIPDVDDLVAGLGGLGYSISSREEITPSKTADSGTSVGIAIPGAGAAFLKTVSAVVEQVAGVLDGDGLPVLFSPDPRACLGVYIGLAHCRQTLGAVVLSAHSGFMEPYPGTSRPGPILGAALGFLENGFPETGSGLEAEQVVLIGLREASPEEARLIRRSRIRVYTMEDIDALGMREVIYRALRTAGMGTDGFHVTLDLDVLDPTVAPGVHHPVRGGLSYREGHLVMEMIAKSGLMRSLAVVDYSARRDVNGLTARTAAEYVLSLFGKKILKI